MIKCKVNSGCGKRVRCWFRTKHPVYPTDFPLKSALYCTVFRLPFYFPWPSCRDVIFQPPLPVLVIFLHVRDRVFAFPLAIGGRAFTAVIALGQVWSRICSLFHYRWFSLKFREKRARRDLLRSSVPAQKAPHRRTEGEKGLAKRNGRLSFSSGLRFALRLRSFLPR